MTDMMKMTMEMGGGRAVVNDVDVAPLYEAIDNFAATLGDGSAMIVIAALAARLAINAVEADDPKTGEQMLDATISILTQTYERLADGSARAVIN